MKNLNFILAFLILAIYNVFGLENVDPKNKVKIGDLAPDFTLNYLNGNSKKLSELKGKIIMLQFTASWCSVCNKEMPFIEKEIWQKNKDNPDFILVAIDLKEDSKTIKKLIKSVGISYPILYDKEGTIFEKYAEKDAGVTRNILIDKKGKIVFLTRLFERNEFDKLKIKIAELLNK